LVDHLALLNLDEFYAYLSIGKTKARELLPDSGNKFTDCIGNRLFAHKKETGCVVGNASESLVL